MGRLSDRLQSVADFVTKGSVLADVGCDHGYLPIYLIETGHIPRAIAMDVNPGPLRHAAEHIDSAGLGKYIETRLSDGLKGLRQEEADSLVIAGMGGALTVRILSDTPDVWRKMREVILQPQSEIEAVRRYLYDAGFCIVRENMVEEDGKYYMMMRGISKTAAGVQEGDVIPECGMTAAYYRYGGCLIRQRHPVLLRYLEKSRRQLEAIRQNLLRQEQTEAIALRLQEVQEKLSVLKMAWEEMTDE